RKQLLANAAQLFFAGRAKIGANQSRAVLRTGYRNFGRMFIFLKRAMKSKVLIVGLGVSGRSAASFLLRKGWRVAAVDRKAETLQLEGVEIELDRKDFPIEGFDLVVVSPGIPPAHPIVQKAKRSG